MSHITALSGKSVQLKITGDDVQVTELAAAAAAAQDGTFSPTNAAAGSSSSMLKYKEAWSGSSWVLSVDQFTPDSVGGKAISAAQLAAAAPGSSSSTSATVQLPAWLHVPPSVSLPHGVFEAVLSSAENNSIRDELQWVAGRVAAAAAAGEAVWALEPDLQEIR